MKKRIIIVLGILIAAVVSEPESGITLKETVRVEPVILLCMCQK